jgi:hypothetical protein
MAIVRPVEVKAKGPPIWCLPVAAVRPEAFSLALTFGQALCIAACALSLTSSALSLLLGRRPRRPIRLRLTLGARSRATNEAQRSREETLLRDWV